MNQRDTYIAKSLNKQIGKIVDYKLKNITTVESAIVVSLNADNTVNLQIPPDAAIYTHVQNQSIYQDLNVGDCVKVVKQNNRSSNMWIIGAHGSAINTLQQHNNTLQNTVNCMACFSETTHSEYNGGDSILWNTELFNNSNKKITLTTNGKIIVNHTGYIKVSTSLWFGKNKATRIWLGLRSNSNDIVTDIIKDPIGGFDTISLANYIMPVTKGQTIDVYVVDTVGSTTGAGAVKLNGGTSRHASHITIEIIQ